jgi:hypothetical protein
MPRIDTSVYNNMARQKKSTNMVKKSTNMVTDLLESRILHPSNLFRTSKVLRRRVTAFLSLSCIVHQVLRHFPKTPAFLAKINNNATTTTLRRFNAFFNGMRQIRSACTNIATKNVAPIAFVMNAAGEFNVFVGNRVWITPNVNGQAANGR